MALTTLQKQPYEERLFSFDFSTKMNAEATIVSIQSIIAELLDGGGFNVLTINAQLAAGQKVQALYGGGINGQTYKITCKCIDSDGQDLELEGKLKVKEI